MAIPPFSHYQLQDISLSTSGSYQESTMKTALPEQTMFSGNIGSKKQKTTPPCDRCRQRRIKCDRLQPICSSCVKYKATCVRTAFPAGAPLSTVSVEAIGTPGLRVTTAAKRDRFHTETEILDSCLRDVQTLQINRLRKIELFFDRLGIDETRLDEISWFTEQLKSQRESIDASNGIAYDNDELTEKLGPRTSISWIKQVLPLLQATKRIQQIPATHQAYVKSLPPQTTGPATALQATKTETGHFHCPSPKPMQFPGRVPLSVLNKTMFELSVYDRTEYLGPVAGTLASSWSEEMRFPLPWLVPEPKLPESLLVLPPMEVVLDLVDWMIKSPLYVYFPILTRACILNSLSAALPGPDAPSLGIDKGYGENVKSEEDSSSDLPQRITGRVSAVFLLNAIMALGAAYRSNAIKENQPHCMLRDPKSREPIHDFQLFFDRSRALTVYILDQPRVSSLQGLLLLMKCPAIPGIQNLYREQACAMALALGLHRDCEPWTLCHSVIQLRRNVFWCCYVIDASYSLNSGSPERFPDDYITIGLPKLPSLEDGDDVGELDAEEETHRIGFLIEQAKLWRIVKKIRRCGQTSNQSNEGSSQGANLFRHPEPFSRFRGSDSGLATSSSSPSSGSPHFGPGGHGGQTPSAPVPPPWVWRADSARRILDVELAQWQMELPARLRFDFALTRKEQPCPFDVRVNGLGAMLQLIFNEVLIILHHPFLLLADSQYQTKREPNSFSAQSRHSKARSSNGSVKSPRSRRSSSFSKANFLSANGGSLNNSPTVHPFDNARGLSQPPPPFFNSCTKAAEAITFLIDHVLKTTPEWLVCHNEAESALHIAERIHILNVSVVSSQGSNDNATLPNPSLQHAKSQLRKTRSFKQKIANLDQFTMCSGWRPDLESSESLLRGSARDRLVRTLRQMVVHKRSANYYRLPRSPIGVELSTGEPQLETQLDSLAGQDHLEMKLAFLDDRIWIRFYNVRIKDGHESKNGAEGWLEVLQPYTPTESERSLDEDDEDEITDDVQGALPFGHPTVEELAAALGDIDDGSSSDVSRQEFRRRAGSSADGGSMDGIDDQMDPPQSSSTTFMELFGYSNPTGIPNLPEVGAYHPHHPIYSQRREYGVSEPGYDAPVYFTGPYAPPDVPLDQFDHVEPPMSLDGPERHPSGDMFAQEYANGAYHRQGPQVQPQPPQNYGCQSPQQQQQQQQMPHPQQQHFNNQYQQRPAHPQQSLEYSSSIPQDQTRVFQQYDLGAPVSTSTAMGFDQAVTSPPYSTPDSPHQPSASEAALGLGLMTGNGGPLSMQNAMGYVNGPYLSLLQRQFPNQNIPTPPKGSNSGPMHSLSHQQTFDPNLDVDQQGARPFYGMPMGGFMAPSLAALPEIRPSTQTRQSISATTASSVAASYLGPASLSSAVATATDASSGLSIHVVSKEESRSPILQTGPNSSVGLNLSTPTSPLVQSAIQMLLSPTTEALQGISNRMNSWDGLPGSGMNSPDQSHRQHPLYQQQPQQQQHLHQQHYRHEGPALDYSNTGSVNAQFAELMDGVETGLEQQDRHSQLNNQQQQARSLHHSIASAVPEKSPSPFENLSVSVGGGGGASGASGEGNISSSAAAALQDKARADEELVALALQGRPMFSLRGSGVAGRR